MSDRGSELLEMLSQFTKIVEKAEDLKNEIEGKEEAHAKISDEVYNGWVQDYEGDWINLNAYTNLAVRKNDVVALVPSAMGCVLRKFETKEEARSYMNSLVKKL